MASERRILILTRLAGNGAPERETKRLCEVCAEVTGMTGAGIMLMSGDLPRGSVCTTNKVSALIEQLQYALGEGPCVDAYLEDRPMLEPDLAEPVRPRWLAFTEPAVEAVRLGALNLYRDRPGPLTDDQHADALVMADVAAQAVLVLQARAPPGLLATALEDGADFQYVVHQSSGMVAAQLDISVAEALIRLRAYAFGNGRALATVAQDVVARTLRFNVEDGDKDPSS
jgi:hypothetical protein